MQIFCRWAAMALVVVSLNLPGSLAQPNRPEREQKFVAMLIWGTDGDKPDEKNTPEDKRLKDVEPALREKFKKIFKWKNYYEVTRKPFTLKPRESKHLELSDKCQVKIRHTDKDGTQVELFGEGKSVVTHHLSMPLKDVLILAGADKNATAWFVVLKPEE